MKDRSQIRPLLAMLALAMIAAPASAQWLVPLGQPVQLNTQEVGSQDIPVVALNSSGGSMAVWARSDFIFSSHLWARRIDPAAPPEQRVDSGATPEPREVQVVPWGGRFVAAWVNNTNVLSSRTGGTSNSADLADTAGNPGTVEGRILDADGAPVSAAFAISTAEFAERLQLTALRTGGFAASWNDYDQAFDARLRVRRFGIDGQPAGPEETIAALASCHAFNVGLGALADGGFTAVWNEYPANSASTCVPSVHARRFDAAGQPAGPAYLVAVEPGGADFLAAVRLDGSLIALRWVGLQQAGGVPLVARLIDPSGQRLGADLTITGFHGQTRPAVAVDDGGNFLIAWTSAASGSGESVLARLFNAGGEPLGAPFLASHGVGHEFGAGAASDGRGRWAVSWSNGTQAYAHLFSVCPEDGSTLCLNGARFRAEVSWRDPRSGATGTGHGVSLSSDTGAFWFFNAENLELMVKVLDGGGVNDHFWVFYGGLTDVEYDLTVTDIATGARRTYHKPGLRLASGADTEAFPTDGLAALSPLPLAPGPGGPSACAGTQLLCLNDDRFTVATTWRDPRTGATGTGQPRPLTGGDTGAFWFFAPENLEVMVKVLDGRAVNGHFWVFFGALSDVEYTVTVTDRTTGAVKAYHNPPYRFGSRADTSAF
jgi:hypothetical protein